jgi:hypothetical protein
MVMFQSVGQSGLLRFWTCPQPGSLKNKTFQKLDLFPSSGEMVGGTDSAGSVKKRKTYVSISTFTYAPGNRLCQLNIKRQFTAKVMKLKFRPKRK